ncbi:transglutaminase domain-containing protein [Streptomyces europaeiscabiei]|uniref:transglutaminase domain-containing protein n=1 Tax=Streptomyces europaeiscabiei TaxID=146819 RepID=UPI0029B518E3|nr:transglutaminase domain-containing protein [Streptomyces europaeiscabiei]MDX2525304.1 transglutaminase domain-containing protein [Streptomyces europaeiscabiei]
MTAVTVSTADVERIMECLRRIPDSYRDFSEPADRVKRFYRIPEDLLECFLQQGLPHRPGRKGGGPLFDGMDLRNIVLNLRIPSPQQKTLKSMSRALIDGESPGVIRRTVNIQGKCPDPGHDGRCEFELAAQVSRSADVTDVRTLADHHFEVDVTLRGGGARYLLLSPAHRQLVDEVTRIEFHHVPFDLHTDLAFLADSGLADCRLAAEFLAARGEELGIEVRCASGLFLSRPFSNRHFWIEFLMDDEWVPADPFFLTVLARWDLLDERDWPPNRVPMGALWPLDFDYLDEPLVTHKGGSDSSYMTR